ncbi:hypothetical protein FHT29_006029 [Rhizobium sp. SG741]|nr:hypothetical protein [Rhizobium sp. SG741]
MFLLERVGAAWIQRDDSGYTIQLEVIPTNCRIVPCNPLEDADRPEAKEGGKQAQL